MLFYLNMEKTARGYLKIILGSMFAGKTTELIKEYNLNIKSRVLDVGCGKGYLLYEIKRILPEIHICGFDRSRYAIKNAHKEIKKDSIALKELSSPEGLEKYAREKYHMKKENEEIFLIIE